MSAGRKRTGLAFEVLSDAKEIEIEFSPNSFTSEKLCLFIQNNIKLNRPLRQQGHHLDNIIYLPWEPMGRYSSHLLLRERGWGLCTLLLMTYLHLLSCS